MRKKIALTVVTVLTWTTVLGGCGKTAQTGSEVPKNTQTSTQGATETTAEKKDPVTLRLCSSENTFGLSNDSELQQSVVDLLEEKTGVQISPIIPPVSSYSDKLETMISGGDVPDVFYISQAMTRLPNYVARGKVLKLNDYIKNSEKLSSIPQDSYDALAIDGSIYHVPYVNPKVKILYMRKDIMEKYGIELSHTPTTEEFMTELQKLKGTGVIPFTFPKFVDNFQIFMNAFGAYAGVYQNKDGVYVDGFQEPQMIDALNYLREMYQSGVLDQEFITTEMATMREYMYTGKAACGIDYTTNYMNYLNESKNAGNETDVFPIYCIYGPDGDGGALNESIQIALCVSSNCPNPDEAVKVIETLVTDPEMYPAFFNIGVEGKHYTVDGDGNMEPTEKAKNSGYSPKFSFLYDSYIPEFKLDFKLKSSLEQAMPAQKEIISEAIKVKGPKYMVPAEKSELFDECSASITSTWKEMVSQIILGSVSVEEGMENYKNFWSSIDGDQILAELNA